METDISYIVSHFRLFFNLKAHKFLILRYYKMNFFRKNSRL